MIRIIKKSRLDELLKAEADLATTSEDYKVFLENKKMYEQQQYENELNGECIMDIRDHCERAGVEVAFADDCVAIVVNELLGLRKIVENIKKLVEPAPKKEKKLDLPIRP